MSPLPTIKQRFTNALIFGVCYVIIFCCFIPTFTHDSQTTAMSAIGSLVVATLTAILYLSSTLALHYTGITRHLWIHTILLFLMTEIAGLIIGDRLPFFGLLEKYIYSHQPHNGDALEIESLNYRQQFDFAFSMAGLWAAMLVVVVRLAIPKVSKYLAAE